MDDAMIVWTNNNDVRGIVILRSREIVNVMCLYHTLAIS